MRKKTTLSLSAASHPKDLTPTTPVIRKETSDINEFKKEDVQRDSMITLLLLSEPPIFGTLYILLHLFKLPKLRNTSTQPVEKRNIPYLRFEIN